MPEIKDGPEKIRIAQSFEFPNFMRFKALSEGLVDCSLYASPAKDPVYVARFNHKLFVQPPSSKRDERAAKDAVDFIEHDIRSKRGADYDIMTIFCHDAAFLRLMKYALSGQQPAFEWRDSYLLGQEDAFTEAPVPKGYELKEVGPSLLAEGLANTDELKQEMCSERPSVDDFLEKSFGICAVKGRELAGWCLSEYNCSEGCEIGIEVRGEHRHKGLALAMTSALIRLVRSKGLKRIGWDCHRQNAASWHTAIKAGLSIKETYPTILICKDKALQYGANGNIALRDGDGDAAFEWYRKSAATGKAPFWVFINMAQIQALTGDIRLVMEAYEGLKTARKE